MDNGNRKDAIEAIRGFWDWFATGAEKLKKLYLDDRLESLMQMVNRELDKVEPQLAWEIGPGRAKPFLLTISGEGDPKLRQIADFMIQLAPDLESWEFYSSRPARPAPAVVRLPESAESFTTSEWWFIPIEQPPIEQLDLIIVDDKLARSDREPALRAVSIYLDQLLGEDTVETWMGEFKIKSSIAIHGKKAYKMAELPDYLLWATHRERNPLRKPDSRT